MFRQELLRLNNQHHRGSDDKNMAQFACGDTVTMSLEEYSELPLVVTEYKGVNTGYVFGEVKDNKRKNDNIISRCWFPLDFDGVPEDIFDTLVETCEAKFINAVVHTSYSHKKTEHDRRYRLIAETCRIMTPEEYPACVTNFINHLVDDVPKLVKYKDKIDPCTSVISQFYFGYSCPPEREADARIQYISNGFPVIPNPNCFSDDRTTNVLPFLPIKKPIADIIEHGSIEGQRHTDLVRIAGTMFNKGMDKKEVLQITQGINMRGEPLPDEEVASIVTSLHKNYDYPQVIESIEQNIGYKFYTLSEAAALPPIKWLIKNVLVADGSSVIYGESGCTKSFLTLDMCLRLASTAHHDWFGISIPTIPVLYIALEGFSSCRLRADAWEKYHKTQPDNFHIANEALPLAEEESVSRFIWSAQQLGFSKGLIVVDTLNKSMPFLNENDSGTMGGILGNIQKIRAALESASLIVTHTGKDNTKGIRGSNSTYADMDNVIYVTKSASDLCNWTTGGKMGKIRDGEPEGVGFSYKLENVYLDNCNENPHELREKSAVVKPLGQHNQKTNTQKLGAVQQRVLDMVTSFLEPMGQQEMVDAIQYAAVRLTEQPSNKRKNIVITKIGELINYGYLVPVNIGGKEMLELKK